MSHPNVFNQVNASENGVSKDPQPSVVYIDVGKKFTTKQKFALHDHILKWVYAQTSKLGFEMYDLGYIRTQTFVKMRCEIDGLIHDKNCFDI